MEYSNSNSNSNPYPYQYPYPYPYPSSSSSLKKPTALNIDYVKTYLDNDTSTDSLTSSSYSASSKHLNYSSDSLSSFEDYRLNRTYSDNDNHSSYYGPMRETSTPTSFIYFKCAVPISSSTCTRSFISSMCCNCGRG